MRAVNHVVTGATIGAAVQNPALALPAAFLSHLLLDVIPHYGIDDHKGRRFLYVLMGDAALSAAFLLAILFLLPGNWLLPVACGVLAASPDLGWLPYWIRELQGKTVQMDPVSSFLARIQWCERPWGLYVEVVWFVAAAAAFLSLSAHL